MARRRKGMQRIGANDFSILNPVLWAQEAVPLLIPNMGVSSLIRRDWDSQVALFGDMVNAYVPGTFALKFKGAPCENIVSQDASGSRIQVALDQWPYISFVICDGEEDRNQLDMIDTLIPNAVLAFARGVDAIVSAQVYQYLSSVGGHLGNISSTNVKDYILETREVMNRNNAPVDNRWMVMTPGTDTEALKLDTIVTADKTGDGGTALRKAILGEKYGFNYMMSQTQPEITGTQTKATAAINNAAGYPAGTTTVAFDGTVGTALAAGQWAVIAGDDTPQHITAVGGGGTTLTLSPGLKRAVADNAVIQVIMGALAVNLVAGYIGTTASPRVVGWRKPIAVDGVANSPPQIGQGVTFGTETTMYTIIGVTTLNAGAGTYEITLDKPLVTALTNDETVNLLPAGKYNFGLCTDGFVLVNRPIRAPRAGTGVLSYTLSDPITKISLRVSISYDAVAQGHRITIDTLMGVGKLVSGLGAAMLG